MAWGIGLTLYLKANKRDTVTHSGEKRNKNKLKYRCPVLLRMKDILICSFPLAIVSLWLNEIQYGLK